MRYPCAATFLWSQTRSSSSAWTILWLAQWLSPSESTLPRGEYAYAGLPWNVGSALSSQTSALQYMSPNQGAYCMFLQ